MNKIYSSNAFSLFLSSTQVNQKISVFASSDDLLAEYVAPVGESAASENMPQASGTPAPVIQSAPASSVGSAAPAMGTGGGGY